MTAKRNYKAAIGIRDDARPAATPQFSVRPKVVRTDLPESPVGQTELPRELSVRAENVLKMLTLDLTGEIPPRGQWTPPTCCFRG